MNKIIYSKFFIFLLSLALIGIIIAVGKETYRHYQVSKEVAHLKKEIESLKKERGTLSNLIDYFSSKKALEKEARLKLNLTKQGEKLVIISSDKVINSENQKEEKQEEISNFKKWWKWLGFDKTPKK